MSKIKSLRRFIPSQKVDAKIIELQKDNRKVTLSIKKLEEQVDKETVAKYGSSDSGGVLGRYSCLLS